MRVLMLKLAAGPAGVFPQGSRVDVPDDLAAALIRAGAAVSLAREPVETATLPEAEQAVLPAPAKRKKRG